MMPIDALGLGFICGSAVLAFVALQIVHQTVSLERLQRGHELTVFCGTVAGTIYAVILAFILFAAWNDFTNAQTVAADEAATLESLAYAGNGLPAEVRSRFEDDTEQYARTVINEEWPLLADGASSPAVDRLLTDMGRLVLEARSFAGADPLVLDHAMTELARLQGRRRTRLLSSQSALPAILWVVLIAGAVITLAFAVLVATGDFTMHAIQVVLLAALLALVLVAIQDIKGPFGGVVHVDAGDMQQTLHALVARRTP